MAVALLLATVPAGRLFTPPAGSGWLASESVSRLAGPELLVGLLAGLLAGAGLPVVLSHRSPKAREQLLARLESIAFFLPRTRTERHWFAALSVTVGVCEEIIFRGFLIRYLEALPLGLGLPGALIGAAVVFGIDHGYQGWSGIVSTAFLALVFSALFFVTGSLWVPIVVHALVDLRLLLILRAPGD